jgi:WD40 repeat protein
MTLRSALSLALVFALLLPAPAQPPCSMPVIPAPKEKNLFSAEQEMWLGEAMAEHYERDYSIIEDDAARFLDRVGRSVLAHLPPGVVRYSFRLVDEPDANAFTTAGGRVYVTRKLVASLRSEDELAGILAHEAAHNYSRDASRRISHWLSRVLNVKELGGREDVYARYHAYLENRARMREPYNPGEHLETQIAADRLGQYLAARAGYSPLGIAEWFDRVLELKGRTGSAFSDFFGGTRPAERRLREMRNFARALASCAGERRASAPAEFEAWRTAVEILTPAPRRESLPGLLWKKDLEPPHRGEILHFRFSPDGRYLLAQDDATIFVLARHPFRFLFRVDASDARWAQFSPDSRSVVLHTESLRVEKWDVETAKLRLAREVVEPGGCLQSELSPDGATLACLSARQSLLLFDVASGSKIFERERFFPVLTWQQFLLLVGVLFGAVKEERIEWVRMAFTPDARAFLASRGDLEIGYDLAARAPLKLGLGVRSRMAHSIAFLGPERMVGVAGLKGEESALVKFPGGDLLTKLNLGGASAAAASCGDFLLLRPVDKFPVGVYDLAAQKVIRANREPALDLCGDVVASERTDGEIELYALHEDRALGRLRLPRSTLGRLRAAALSPDMKWLAVSGENRGSVWDLERGARPFHVRGFHGAWFGEPGALFADFPKSPQAPRNIARLDQRLGRIQPGFAPGEMRGAQYGGVMVLLKTAGKDRKPEDSATLLETHDVRSGELLWSRTYPGGAPRIYSDVAGNVLALVGALDPERIKRLTRTWSGGYHVLDLQYERPKSIPLELVDARSGKTFASFSVDSGQGSYSIQQAFPAGEWVALSDTENRVLVFSVEKKELVGRVFGHLSAISSAAGMMAVENQPGVVTLYALPGLERRREFAFSSPVAFAEFSADGRRLFVLTRGQSAHILDVASGTTSGLPQSPLAFRAPRVAASGRAQR